MKPATLQSEFFHAVPDARELLDALDRIPEAMFMVKDVESRYMYMSRALREVIRLRAGEDVIGKTDFELFPGSIAESYRQNDLLVLRQGRTLINEIHAIAYLVGPTRWVFSSKFPIHDRRGAIIGLITLNSLYKKSLGEESDLDQLLPAIDHITKHYVEKVSIADLAALTRMSASHFMRLFKQRMQMTTHTFLEQVRLYHAIDEVKHTNASIASIALRCGFSDHSSFIKRFKKLTGMTPLRYRREYQH